MKYQSLFVLLCVVCAFVSCSNDDDTSPGQTETTDYFPVNLNNYWVYDILVSNDGMNPIVETDSLYVATVSGNQFTLGVDTTNIIPSFTNSMLTSGTLTKNGNMLLLDSNLSVPLNGVSTSIGFTDLVLYNSDASANEELYTDSGTFTESFQGMPITVTYRLSSVKVGELDSLTFNLVPYPTVETVDVNLEISISTTVDVFGMPTTISILDMQEVLKMRTYYAANVGIVKSDTMFSYQLNPTTVAALNSLNINLGIPTSDSQVTIEELNSYFVEN